MTFNVGLVINPLAGLGGSVGLKGSDNVAEQALALGAVPKANIRCLEALSQLSAMDVCIYTFAGDMGENCALQAGIILSLIHI